MDGLPLHFAAPPPNLLPIVPFALLPGDSGAGVLVGVNVVAAVFIVRALRLRWWWLLFPPLLEGVFSANVQVPLTALLVLGGLGASLAPVLKIYAFIPLALLGRYRALALSVALVALASLITLPLWPGYVADLGAITARLIHESGGGFSATATPLLLPAIVIAITVLYWLDRPRAGWLAVPGLWPSSQFHYGTLYMPVADRWTVWLMAVPLGWMAPAVVILLAAVTLIRHRRHRGALPTLADPRA